MNFSPKARKLIAEFENFDPHVNYPGLQSGPTFGYGYDIGQRDAVTFTQDWKRFLHPNDYAVLLQGVGLKGEQAAAYCKRRDVRSIVVHQSDAAQVLDFRDIPEYTARTRRAFPGFDELPGDAQGALVSLVFNRGAALQGPTRVEMEAIHNVLVDGVQKGDLSLIATQLRAMKHLWEGKNMGGLIRRREAEAVLVESCIPQSGSVPV